MNDVVIIQEWAVHADPFAAPELRRVYLHGRVYGHPREGDGKSVITSKIRDSKGRIVTTESGTVYRLGRINRKYRRYLKKEGIPYDPRNPIKMIV